MVLSDHNTTSSYEEFRALVDPRTLVIPGTEITTYNGHCLAIGVEDWIDWRTGLAGRSINEVARAVRAAGGIFVVAHPDAMPDDVCTGCRWTHDDFDPALADAVEIWGGLWDGPEEENEGCVALWRRWLGLGHRLAATAATDAHRPKDWEGAVPLTYVLADELSRAAILDAIRAGRTYVSSGPELYLEPRTARRARRAARARPRARELRIIANGAASRRSASPATAGGRAAAATRGWAYAELWNAEGDSCWRPPARSIARPGSSRAFVPPFRKRLVPERVRADQRSDSSFAGVTGGASQSSLKTIVGRALLLALVGAGALAADPPPPLGWYFDERPQLRDGRGNSRASTLGARVEVKRLWSKSTFTLGGSAVRADANDPPRFAVESSPGHFEIETGPRVPKAAKYNATAAFDRRVSDRFGGRPAPSSTATVSPASRRATLGYAGVSYLLANGKASC